VIWGREVKLVGNVEMRRNVGSFGGGVNDGNHMWIASSRYTSRLCKDVGCCGKCTPLHGTDVLVMARCVFKGMRLASPAGCNLTITQLAGRLATSKQVNMMTGLKTICLCLPTFLDALCILMQGARE